MPGKAAKVIITERQQEVLQTIIKSPTASQQLMQRAKIILLAFEGWLNEKIALEVGIGRGQVGVWRRRWKKNFEQLTLIECMETGASFQRAAEELLSDAPRSGANGKFTAEQVAQLLAIACEPPENSGRPITQWTHVELANEVMKRGIVESISASRVGHYLREAEIKPHKTKYWLNTKEKDPELFQQQVKEVCDCYHEAPELHRQKIPTHTVSVDEMTGIQALEQIATTLPMQPRYVERREFEYKRHGTQTLIGNFHVVTGEMISPTVGETRTEEDFVNHIRQTVEADSKASWIFVADNLSTHCSASLVEYVNEVSELNESLGKKRKRGHSEIDGKSAGFSEGEESSNSFCLHAEAQQLAESN